MMPCGRIKWLFNCGISFGCQEFIMKIKSITLVSLFSVSFACWSQPTTNSQAHNEVFGLGEELTYKATFLGITAGTAVTRVDKLYHQVLSNTCYKIDVFGETSSWLSIGYKVKDLWGTYMDTTSLATRASYRKIRENNYRKTEWVTFDQEANKASVQVVDKKTEKYGEPKIFDIPPNATDLVGGFMHLRFFEFDKLKKGDTLSLGGFFEDSSYILKILYRGKDVVKTKFGKVPCHVLIPIVPDNEIFDGSNSITVWISEDKNKIPVKMSAKMFVGSTGIELVSFRGLKNSIRVLVEQ
jgi:Protein of unknown function (DUF3108)